MCAKERAARQVGNHKESQSGTFGTSMQLSASHACVTSHPTFSSGQRLLPLHRHTRAVRCVHADLASPTLLSLLFVERFEQVTAYACVRVCTVYHVASHMPRHALAHARGLPFFFLSMVRHVFASETLIRDSIVHLIRHA